jgi:hypothetical protein
VRVVSRTDVGRPQLKRFSVRPGSVDVRATDQTVTVTLRAVDSQSGVRAVAAWFWGRQSGSEAAMRRVAGTSRHGIWAGTFRLPRCTAQAGILRARVELTDGFGRHRTYGRARLAARGWPSELAVAASDHSAPTAFVPFTVPATGPITVTFTEDVNGITSHSAAVHQALGDPELDVDPTTLGPALVGTWTCQTRDGAATDCETGQARTARFTPADPLAASSYYAVIVNPEFSLDVTDLAGNPVIAEDLTVRTRP